MAGAVATCSRMISVSYSGHYEKLASGLWKMFRTKSGVDCALEYGTWSVPAHGFVIELFLPHRLSPDDAPMDDLEPDQEKNSLQTFLEFLYRGKITVREDQLEDLLEVSKSFQFQMLVDAIESAVPRLRDIGAGSAQKTNDPTDASLECSDGSGSESESSAEGESEPIDRIETTSSDFVQLAEKDAGDLSGLHPAESNDNDAEKRKSSLTDPPALGTKDLKQDPVKSKLDEGSSEPPYTSIHTKMGIRLKCLLCSYTARHSSEMKRHTQLIHRLGECQYICRTCGKRCYPRSMLIRHEVIHQKRFKCSICAQAFKTCWQLKVHLRHTHQVTTSIQEIAAAHGTLKLRIPRKRKENSEKAETAVDDVDEGTSGDALPVKRKGGRKRKFTVAELKCPHCRYQAKKRFELLKHLEVRHEVGPSRYKCETCGKRCISQSVLIRHNLIHLNKFKCVCCMEMFNTQHKLVSHLQKDHDREDVNAAVTIAVSEVAIGPLPENLSLTMRAIENTNPGRSTSPSFFKDDSSATEAAGSPKCKFKCPHCVYSTGRNTRLDRHLKTVHRHTNVIKVKCPLCPDEVETRKDITNHLRQAHGCEVVVVADMNRRTKKFGCDLCPFKTRYHHSLKRHLWLQHHIRPTYHSDTNTLDGHQLCPKKSRGSEIVEELADVTTATRPGIDSATKPVLLKKFVCALCSFKTGYRNSWKHHLVVRHKMSLSDYAAMTNDDRRTTLKPARGSDVVEMVEKEKADGGVTGTCLDKFPCPHCDHKPLDCDSLNRHLQLGHNIDPSYIYSDGKEESGSVAEDGGTTKLDKFRCPHCDFKTGYQDSLKRHLWLLHNIGPSHTMCRVCGMNFLSVHALSRHRRTHHLPCPFCSATVATSYRLKAHIEDVHVEPGQSADLGLVPCSVLLERLPVALPKLPECEDEDLSNSILNFVKKEIEPTPQDGRLRSSSTHVIAKMKVAANQEVNKLELVETRLVDVDHNYVANSLNPEPSTPDAFPSTSAKVTDEHVAGDGFRRPMASYSGDDGSVGKEPSPKIDEKGRQIYNCEQCSFEGHRLQVIRHAKEVHGVADIRFVCSTCDKPCMSRSLLIAHQLTHTKEKTVACGLCRRPFGTSINLKMHMRGVHGVLMSESNTVDLRANHDVIQNSSPNAK